MEFNDTIKDFFKAHLVEIDSIIKKYPEQVELTNWSHYGRCYPHYVVYSSVEEKNVPIRNIVGTTAIFTSKISGLFELLNRLYNSKGNEYEQRSIKMLSLSRHEVLQSCSEKVDISLNEMENGDYLVAENGNHRFAFLKVLYLNDLVCYPQYAKSIENDYVIKARVRKVDIIKTYCNYILSSFLDEFTFDAEIDSNGEYTGKSILKINENELVFTDEQLIMFTKNALLLDDEIILRNKDDYNFMKFLDDYMDIAPQTYGVKVEGKKKK